MKGRCKRKHNTRFDSNWFILILSLAMTTWKSWVCVDTLRHTNLTQTIYCYFWFICSFCRTSFKVDSILKSKQQVPVRNRSVDRYVSCIRLIPSQDSLCMFYETCQSMNHEYFHSCSSCDDTEFLNITFQGFFSNGMLSILYHLNGLSFWTLFQCVWIFPIADLTDNEYVKLDVFLVRVCQKRRKVCYIVF